MLFWSLPLQLSVLVANQLAQAANLRVTTLQAGHLMATKGGLASHPTHHPSTLYLFLPLAIAR